MHSKFLHVRHRYEQSCFFLFRFVFIVTIFLVLCHVCCKFCVFIGLLFDAGLGGFVLFVFHVLFLLFFILLLILFLFILFFCFCFLCFDCFRFVVCVFAFKIVYGCELFC